MLVRRVHLDALGNLDARDRPRDVVADLVDRLKIAVLVEERAHV
jgi:hypothetical protein